LIRVINDRYWVGVSAVVVSGTPGSGGDREAMTKRLFQDNSYINVLREGMAIDALDFCGIYLGTTTGQIFYNRDDGDSWELILNSLPPILSLETGPVV